MEHCAVMNRGSSRCSESFEDIRLGREPVPGLKEAKAALAVVEKIHAAG